MFPHGEIDAESVRPRSESFASKVVQWFRGLLGSNSPKRSQTELTLIQGILADPENDVPLLNYADWLEQQGNPQGEFIRVDLAFDRLTPSEKSRSPLDKRWSELYQQHGASFVKPLEKLELAPVTMGMLVPILFLKRGVIGRVEIERAGIVPKKLAALFAIAPLIDELELNFDDIPIQRIVRCPQMAQVRILKMGGAGQLDEAAIKALQSLQNLSISSMNGTSAEMELFAKGTYNQLEVLAVSQNGIGDEGFRALSRTKWIRGLRELDLASCELNAGAGELLASTPFQRLEKLDLSCNELGDEGLISLVSSPSLTNLKTLNLVATAIGDQGVLALTGSTTLPQLEQLFLNSNDISYAGAVALAEADWPKLNLLAIDGSTLGEKGEQLLKKRFGEMVYV